MNREERRHPKKALNVRQVLQDFSTIQKVKSALESGWQFQPGDKVQLNLSTIKGHPDYDKKVPAYKEFCEQNVNRIFTVEYAKGLNPSVVCLAEDKTDPKWLFWIGDLTPFDETME